jgi:uncharacterized HAD superfamily protein
MKIGVDLDNTLQIFQPFWAEVYNEYFGRNLKPENLTGWGDIAEMTHFESSELFLEWWDRARGIEKMPYTPGGPGAIDAFLEAGHTVHFITARRTEYARKATQRWHAESPWAKTSMLTVGRHDKWSIPCSVYIDDSPAVINGIIDAGKPVIIFDQPWNEIIPKPAACDLCDGAGHLDHVQVDGSTTTRDACRLCKGTGNSSPVLRAKTWRDVVNQVEAMSRA